MERGRLAFLADRTAVLFVGLATGAIVTAAFYTADVPAGPAVAPQPAIAAKPAAPVTAPPASMVMVGRALADAAVAGRDVHVGVFGDSFGDGIWAALYNGLRKEDAVKVHQFSERSTGFTRYRSMNVLDDIRGKIDRQPVDIAVISFGCNDTQGIYENGHGAKFMDADWQRIVSGRLAAIVTLLRDRGTQVYWVGLPRMRKPEFDTNIQQINAFFAAQAHTLNVPFIDTVPASVDADGNYAPYIRNPETGERVNARANDGIHMTMNGYGFLVRGLTKDIRQSISEARAQAHRQEGPNRRSRMVSRLALLAAAAGAALIAPAAMAKNGAKDGPAAPECDLRLCYSDAIAPFLAKLRAEPRKAHVPVHIIQIGDSHTAGDMITNGWRTQLQARYGNGGRGVLAGGKPYSGYLTWGVTASQTPGWMVNATFGKTWVQYGPELGISGFTQSAAAPGERLGIAADSSDQYFDAMTVCAISAPGAGSVLLRMGALIEEEWRLDSPERKPVCRTMTSRYKVSNAEIVTLSEGQVSITSFGTFRSDGGVILSNLGVVGSQAIHLNRADDAVMRAEFAAYEPDLIVLAFGTNEGFAPNFSLDNYEALLRRQVTRIRKLAGPDVPILLLGAPDAATRQAVLQPVMDCGNGLGPPKALGEVRSRQIRVARDMRLGFWNWAAAMGADCAAFAWKTSGQMRGDYVHFTKEGGALIGQMLGADIARASLSVRPGVLHPRLFQKEFQVSAGNLSAAEAALRDQAADAPPKASEAKRP